MNRLLVTALLSVCIMMSHTLAGEKFKLFSGNIIYVNNENRSLTVKRNKKRISFFVAGSVIHDNREVSFSKLTKGCAVTVTYKKSRRRFIANRVTLKECTPNALSDSR